MAGRRKGMVAGLFAAFAGVMLGTSPAHADEPMTFEWGTVYGDVQAIFAHGEFTPETPAALKAFLKRSAEQVTPETMIYMNSLGGDLASGMEVGKMIRQAKLNTAVAKNSRNADEANTIDLDAFSRVYPGYCVSACSLAFLGGVKREVRPGSIFAVHQVSMNCVDKRKALQQYPWVAMPNVTYCPELDEALTMVQIANGAVVEYVRSMGVDPIFLTEMSRAGPGAVNALAEDKLKEYKIVYEYKTESWEFQTDAQGQFFLRYRQGNQWKEDKAEIFCNRTAAPKLYLWVVHELAAKHWRDRCASRGRARGQGTDSDLADGRATAGRLCRHSQRAIATLRDHRPAEADRARQHPADDRPVAALPRCRDRRHQVPSRDDGS
ncbi:MAG: hypothetical protein QM773_15030 [Hyphomonadaceae bacterium]